MGKEDKKVKGKRKAKKNNRSVNNLTGSSFIIGDVELKNILITGNYVSVSDMSSAEKVAAKENISVKDYLLSENLIDKDILGQAIADHFKVDYADLNSKIPNVDQVKKIPAKIAKKFRAVLFSINDEQATIATDNPKQPKLASAMKSRFKGRAIKINYSLSDDIDFVLASYRKSLETRFSRIIKQKDNIAPEIINEIIDDAISYKSSDIHFEPQAKEVIIRFRVDGVLQEAGRVPKDNYENILNRIKVQANLRIDEHSSAQDGAIRLRRSDHEIDMRVSIIPTIEGEKIVARLLAKYVQGLNLSDLGLSAKNQKKIKDAYQKPFGMILVTGPTGSGKTTTLYSLLKLLNRPGVNVTTIEDPVEYRIKGVNQIQVNKETNLTFAKGLRSIVRQDPDIILVGEIRDQETSEIAVNAALTGHLLLSTFHANDASSAVPRLLDMGSEPFLLASTLELVVAQRLVRKICEHCRYSFKVNINDLKQEVPNIKDYFSGKSQNFYKGKGCSLCNHTGYSGRIALFEIIDITPEMEELILKNPSAQEIWKLGKKQGSNSLFDDGIDKVKNGITTIEEVKRVASALQ